MSDANAHRGSIPWRLSQVIVDVPSAFSSLQSAVSDLHEPPGWVDLEVLTLAERDRAPRPSEERTVRASGERAGGLRNRNPG